jgi:hypothetical protein
MFGNTGEGLLHACISSLYITGVKPVLHLRFFSREVFWGEIVRANSFMFSTGENNQRGKYKIIKTKMAALNRRRLLLLRTSLLRLLLLRRRQKRGARRTRKDVPNIR